MSGRILLLSSLVSSFFALTSCNQSSDEVGKGHAASNVHTQKDGADQSSDVVEGKKDPKLADKYDAGKGDKDKGKDSGKDGKETISTDDGKWVKDGTKGKDDDQVDDTSTQDQADDQDDNKDDHKDGKDKSCKGNCPSQMPTQSPTQIGRAHV